jgi:hypothetical protein
MSAPGVPQMCTVDDLLGPLAEPCLRLARWVWQPSPDDHPVYLCNYHAEPLHASVTGPLWEQL